MSHSGGKTRGLFGRLLLTFAGLGFAIALAFVVSFHFFSTRTHKALALKNIKNYAKYIADDIGAPPDIEVAQKKAEKLGLVIGIVGENIDYKSSPEMPSLTNKGDLSKTQEKRFFRRHHIIAVKKNGYQFTFGINKEKVDHSPTPLVVAILLSLVFVAIAYHRVEKMFKPLLDIKQAARSYAEGDFSYQLQPIGKGLFPELSIAINEMSQKIQSMLEAKRELLLAIAHELRTPITRAKLQIEFIDDENIKSKISEELNEMSQQVSDILEGERIKDGHNDLSLQLTKLSPLIKEVIERNFSEVDPIICQLDPSVEQEVDPLKYQLVIKNLLSNAIRHSQNKPVEVHLSSNELSVIDHGMGITETDIQRVTEAFYRVDKGRGRQSGGFGLGLYLVSQILKAHGHQLKITSDGMTKFTIYF